MTVASPESAGLSFIKVTGRLVAGGGNQDADPKPDQIPLPDGSYILWTAEANTVVDAADNIVILPQPVKTPIAPAGTPWNTTATYTAGTLVFFNGSSWTALVDNTGVTPAEGATWTKAIEFGTLLDPMGIPGPEFATGGTPAVWGWNGTIRIPGSSPIPCGIPDGTEPGSTIQITDCIDAAGSISGIVTVGPVAVVDYEFVEGTPGSGVTSSQTGSGTKDDPYQVQVSLDPDLFTGAIGDPQVAGYVADTGSQTRAKLDELYATAADVAAETARAEAAEAEAATTSILLMMGAL